MAISEGGSSAGLPASDPVEIALAEAITRAANDGRHDVIPVLVRELEARREARAHVVKLDVERTKRGQQ